MKRIIKIFIMRELRLIQMMAVLLFFIANSSAQENEKVKKWSLSGYISSMQSVMMVDSFDSYWITDYLLHNRLNFHWYPNESFSATIQVRNRFMYGDQIKNDEGSAYKNSLENDNGGVDMAYNLAEGKSYILNTMVDRAWIQYTYKNFEARIGRQRINWGQTFVWNPNDIFNTYSFFDFDYPERPGSDAIRLQYYLGMASEAEIAMKIDSSNNITAAGLIRFNKFKYDFQFLGGILNSEDITIGVGWSGNISNVAFRGEMSYFHPYENMSDTSGLFFISLGLDYSFSNSLYIQFEGLYRDMPKGFDISSFLEFYSGPLSVKNLSFTEYNIFMQGSFPITPLLNGTLAGMYYPKLKGYYIGPSLGYSLMDNLEFSFYVQLFSGKLADTRQNFYLGFLRFKYSF